MIDTITREELKEKMKNDDLTLVEVLSEESYREGHIPGAINIPLEQIGRKASEAFSREDEIAVYCADVECQASPKAAKKLKALGFDDVYDYEGGKKDWVEGGESLE